MLSRFFIARPIFATVISILFTLAGGIAVFYLPIAQYPPVAPPTVQVDCNYPGASSKVVAETVAATIEQQVNGVQDMLYMSSQSTSDGSYTLTVTFKPGVDLNLAQVLVQNRVALALPQLPDVVRQTGVTTKKRSPDILLTVSLNSPDGRYDQLYLSNYAVLRIKDELARLPGISEVLVFGQRDYSMRVWVDPDKLAVRNLAVSDVIAAIREQNFQPAIGQVGAPPTPGKQLLQIPLTIKGRLVSEEDFGNIVVRNTPDGRILRIRDIGYAELNARSQDINNRFDGKPTVGLAIWQLPDANALATADSIKSTMQQLSEQFPEGVVYEIGYDTTPFIRESIHEVFNALRDAILLVALVVLVFLQGWRAAVIPLLAVPVAIVGTFAAMYFVGFSLNNLTLFGLVLAIGIVVDDAIVVVESVEHHIEKGLSPRQAALKAMEEVSGPVVAVGLVLTAVFVPCTFISGIVGQFFRQFALTIAVSTVLSTINSLTLSPALAALLLRKPGSRRDPLTWLLDMTLGWLFRLFDFGFRKTTSVYTRAVGGLLRVPALVLVLYVGLLGLTGWGYRQLPTGFIPSQDKGYLIASVQLPDASSAVRTRDVVAKIEQIAMAHKAVKNVNSVAGNSFILSAYGSNFGSMFIILKSFDERRGDPEQYADDVAAKLRADYARLIPEALVNVFPAPAVNGLGRAGGFKFMVEDRGDVGLLELQRETDNLVAKGNQVPGLVGLTTVYNAKSPVLFIDIDREQCEKQGVNLGNVFATLQGYLGSRYVNDFNRFGRTWQVVVQADARFRNEIEDVDHLQVRSVRGTMVPIGTLATVKLEAAPLVLTRYNMYPAAAINGATAKGFSTGQAIQALEGLSNRELATNVSYEWTELTYLERTTSDTGLIIFVLSVVFVFLVLAALYESWSLPLAVILVVPMCVLCSIAGVWWAGLDINVFTQIGFVVLVGLACKNAILIVEFAKLRRDEGVGRREATLHACELRLRPIVMTSFAFILGVVPLVIATGAGAEMRRALGITVFSGMLGVTAFGVVLTPVFFYVIDKLSESTFFGQSRLAKASDGMLDLLRLAPLRSLANLGWSKFKTVGLRAPRRGSRTSASANGATQAPASGTTNGAANGHAPAHPTSGKASAATPARPPQPRDTHRPTEDLQVTGHDPP
ncbi:efflux RND transporter permease subunit [Planctomyces sp. SH-PL14]|uniref:efflux RND transporter permease subunit n=1 Tax=Planctomyces sp. SH-PL14 TaxID=1632864 RepID=UPI00078BEC7A|nr:multidrug efflux RND transporter permease subunit [Planctomyces sp. SH-PL14]AMV16251.1 Efflux pump membrane transporter BepE [Planctomyces sp. SH-PL14]